MILGYYPGDFSRVYSGTNSQYNSGTAGAQLFNLNGPPLYNGNITSWTSRARNDQSAGAFFANRYRYDLLNRIMSDTVMERSGSAWILPQIVAGYSSRYTYDPNGNIITLKRNAGTGVGGMDDLSYTYTTGTNKLRHISDTYINPVVGDDLGAQVADNYVYDAIGNLTKDDAGGIGTNGIEWNVYGKVSKVTKTNGTIIKFSYDASGNRVMKEVESDSIRTTWYVRDASGNVMATYQSACGTLGTFMPTSGDKDGDRLAGTTDPIPGCTIYLTELPIYGSDRIGMVRLNQIRTATNPDTVGIFTRYLDKKLYELKDHLGNVRATVTDLKLPQNSGAWFEPDVVSYNYYYPFGMSIGRGGSWGESYAKAGTDDYRYGFNGMEKDNEIKGNANSYDFGARIYDPRGARWLSIDPFDRKYPSLSPFNAMANSPIIFVDPDGRDLSIGGSDEGRLAQSLADIKSLVPSAFHPYISVSNDNKIVFDYANVPDFIKTHIQPQPNAGVNLLLGLTGSEKHYLYSADNVTSVVNRKTNELMENQSVLDISNVSKTDYYRNVQNKDDNFSGPLIIQQITQGLPVAPYDAQVTINPDVTFSELESMELANKNENGKLTDNQKKGLVLWPKSRASVVFHELSESYHRTDGNLPYQFIQRTGPNTNDFIKLDSPAGAHSKAEADELYFHDQSRTPGRTVIKNGKP